MSTLEEHSTDYVKDHDITVSSIITRVQMEAGKFMESKYSSMNHSIDNKSKKCSHPNQCTSVLIDWNKRCPGVNFDFVDSSTPIQMLPIVPSISQESIVVEDLLSCLQGLSGCYITANPLVVGENRTFTINDKLDRCWKHLASNILPFASYYSLLTRFVEENRHFHCGQVNHALASCLTKLRNDYMSLVTKLEDQRRRNDLNMHKLHSQIQPYLFSFEMINNICQTIIKEEASGGKTLSLLHSFAKKCAGKEEELCEYLLETSAVPYMKQLQNWLYHGIITDPFNEFLVQDNQVVLDREQLPDEYSDDYWGRCYTINKDKTPVFLEKSTNIILSTGKYLNVLRQCGLNTKSNQAQEIIYTFHENKYTEAIQKSYQFASSSLLEHLMKDNDLIGHLKSVKHYLLFDQGDFIMKFMDMSELELNKEIGDIVPSRLQTLVELALRTSSASSDPYKDNIKTELHQADVMSLLLRIISSKPLSDVNKFKSPCGWESLSFLYEAKWPISLVLNQSSLMIYQLMFRFFFYCKYVERLLCKVWVENKATKCLPTRISKSYIPAWDLRQRMLLFIQNLEYYMMVEVVEPNWNIFITKLQSSTNLDQVLQCHNDFQTTCLSECMLIKPQHFKILNKFLKKCVEFCHFMYNCNEMKSPTHQSLTPSQQTIEFREVESFSQKIMFFNKSFSSNLHDFFRAIREASKENGKLMDVLNRLDFNSYYKNPNDEKKRSRSNSTSKVSVSEISG